MKQLLFICAVLMTTTMAFAQKEMGLAVSNSNTALPFSKFSGLVGAPIHPGAEFSYGFNLKAAKKHDWYMQLKLGYFYHRFVQHGIPVYSNLGYRYKISSSFFAESSIGAGYLHVIPDKAKLKLDDNGEYSNNKGVGRMQALAVFNLGMGYTFKQLTQKPVTVFSTYQQNIQTPFVRSYVPLLPYNQLLVGVRTRIKN